MVDGTILPRNAERAVADAVLDALRQDADVQAVFGHPARLFESETSQPIYPYAVLERHETRPNGSADVSSTEHILTLGISSRFGGRRYAREFMGAIRAAVERASFSIPEQQVVLAYTSYGDVFRARDRRTLRGLLRIRLITEELN
ncbi:MAG: DUF3168 domain-containing protein [Pseudomonadota bacterium]